MTTKAKYMRVRQQDKKEEKPSTDILMKMSPTYGRYVSRALTLFFGQGKSFITLKAAGRLMYRALWVAEVVKRKVPGLHQITQIKERQIVDVYEPKEQGLLRVQQKRFLALIEITLTKQPTSEQKKAPGYQLPLKLQSQDFLTKQKWQKQQKQRKQRLPDKDWNNNDRRDQDRGYRQPSRYDKQRRGQVRRRGRN